MTDLDFCSTSAPMGPYELLNVRFLLVKSAAPKRSWYEYRTKLGDGRCVLVFFFIKAFVFLILHDTLCPKFHIFAQDAAGFKWDIAAGFIRQKMFSGQICLNLHLTMTIHFTSSLLGVAIYLIRAHTPHCTHWLGYALINSDWAAQFALVATGSMLAC